MRNTLFIDDILLVSSPNGGGLSLLRGDLSLKLSHDDATGLAVGLGHIAWCRQTDGSRVVRILRDGRVRSMALSEQPLDLHDICLDGEQAYVACTLNNEVLQLDADLNVVGRWALPGEQDSVHLNSVMLDGSRLLASIFGRFEQHRGYKDRSRGAGEVVDVRSGEALITGLSQPHSLRKVGGALYLCNSEENELRIYEGTTLVRKVALPGYTRGLAVTAKHVYVGLSRSRNDPEPGSAGRFPTAVVAVLDRETLAVAGYVPVAANEIYDIVAIDDVSLAHDLAAVLWQEEREANGAQLEAAATMALDLQRQLDEGAVREVQLGAQLQHLDAEQTRLRDVIAARDATFEEWKAARKGFEDEIGRLRAMATEARVSEVKYAAQLQQHEAERTRLRDVIAARDASFEEWKAARKGFEDEIGRLRAMATEARVSEVKYAAQLQQHEAEQTRLRDVIAARDATFEEWKAARESGHAAQLRQLEAEQARLQSLIAVRNEEIERLRGAVAERSARLDLLMQDAASNNLEIRVLREAVTTTNTRAVDLQLSLDDITQHVQRLQDWFDAQTADMHRLQQAFDTQRENLVKMTGRATRLQLAADELELVKASRSWKLTRPLRAAMRLLRGDASGGHDLSAPPQADMTTAVSATATDHAAPETAVAALPRAILSTSTMPLPTCAEPLADMDDVYVWGVIDWHFRTQRPQHLAQELARAGRRVFYISNNLVDRDHPGFRVEALDDSGRLFQVNLFAAGRPVIYHGAPDAATADNLRESLACLLAWARSRSTVSLIQHPFWAQTAPLLPCNRVVYDCMDHHAGFENNSTCVLELEHALMRQADLLVLSSEWLEHEYASFNDRRVIVRNAGEYSHFSPRPERVFADEHGRKVIGYYGAIAEWFDVELVRAVATAHPDCLVLLIGRDTTGAQAQLADCPNVHFTGEVGYAELPFYLHGFDVCLLPFQVIPLTLATNPVKLYEYLGAGKTVVSVDLPEIHQFGDLVTIAATRDAFVQAVGAALRAPSPDALVERRRAFAAEQTWGHRATSLLQAIDAISDPRVSVVVVTYNNLEYTQACLSSLERHSAYPAMEIIVVDNASGDGTQAFLQDWVLQGSNRKIILSPVNTGFAAGNNLGLMAAEGEYLVMLNNDTYVTPGWVRTLIGHLRRDPGIGLVGPVTNNIGNEAKIEIGYHDMPGMIVAAGDYTRRHPGGEITMRTVAFFCVAMHRDTFEAIGPLDEAFGTGFFEDDDYCRRAEANGLRAVCAEDVFVHHHLSASFNKLKQEHRKELFERNKAIYEAKWGAWVPHGYRKSRA